MAKISRKYCRHCGRGAGSRKGVQLICQAPKEYGKDGEICGALFYGRADRLYCSQRCKERHDKRHWRERRAAAGLPTHS